MTESKLFFDPSPVAPGQTVIMTSEAHTIKARGVEISGSHSSYVYIDNVKKYHDVIDYPIQVSADGSFETSFNVPISKYIIARDSVEVTTLDTAGRAARGTLHLKGRSVTVTPSESVRGTKITIEGTGFFANAEGAESSYEVHMSYGGIQLGSSILDDVGSFKKSFTVPASAAVGEDNQIVVMVDDWPSVAAYASHSIPEAVANVTPDVGFPGEAVWVIGTGFTPYRQVTIGIGHLLAKAVGPVVHTNGLGSFEILVKVPLNLPESLVDLKVYAQYPIEVASMPFKVR